jgi:hypothetical protein
MSDLCYIKTKHSLKKRQKHQKIATAIKEKITSIHDYQNLRSNGMIHPELILMVCNCVENTIKKHAGVNKKEFVVEILNDIYSNCLSPAEMENVRDQCQHNFDNSLIEVVPLSMKIFSILWNYIKRKL